MSSVAAAPDAVANSQPEFVKALTLTDATMLVAGSMIGSGIFLVSADIARQVGSPFWLIMAWVLSGIMTVLGALAYGELAAMYPRAGGQYVFLRESMGHLMGFLYGWTLFVVIQTGTIAAVAVAFGRFLGVLWPAVSPERFGWFPQADFCVGALGCRDAATQSIQLGLTPQRLVALIMIWVLTWVNLRGVREGKLVQTTLTWVKTLALAGLIVLGLTVGRNATAIAANFGAGNFGGFSGVTGAFVLAFGAAMVGSLFSSDAWNNVTFAAAEVQQPQRNLPRALLFGTGTVCLLYIIANFAYLSVLPLHGDPAGASALARGIQYATQDRVGTAAAEMIFGGAAATIMAVAILISTFGCNNGLILAGARVYFAMARDRLFFRNAGRLNRNHVPAAALLAQSLWTSILCLTGTYGQLLDFVIFAALVFYVATTAGLFILRRKLPDAPRPYRAVGYPVLPALYIVLAIAVAIILLIADKTRTQAFSGLVLVLIGVPVYFAWRAVEGRTPVAVPDGRV
ncbi:MAG: amino acid permease [Gemmatimonadaceae bacterium]|nr:amino acid permease [Gemmatimonadaceae bacterium]NUQ92779.1 amino acid permease [Gemmatimonadaceae bacterium]NUR19376.1 amino acid permease [Gemmatimonadaceae bacterium]